MGNEIASCSHVTISADEAYVIRRVDGNVEVVQGPAQVPKIGRRFEKTQATTASDDEYLRVKFKNGTTQFVQGPASIIPDPLMHVGVELGSIAKLVKGQTLLVYREQEGGRMERILLEGPCTYMPRSAMEWTTQVSTHMAAQGQYLKVQHLDGKMEYKVGPTTMVLDPEKYKDIQVESAVQVGDQELLVVYRTSLDTPTSSRADLLCQDGAVGGVAVHRNLVKGPCMYMPESPSEWIHEFSWTGNPNKKVDVNGPQTKKPDALKFTKLRTAPGKMYYDVESVRTKDNALITVKLMIFFNYDNIERMLDNTSDPFGDLINAVTADIIEWCAPKKFDEFLAATEQLNLLSTYQQLQQALQKIGMMTDKVVFRGYQAPASLQHMHDSAIEKRTALSLAREAEEEEQNLADYKLQKERERCEKQQQLELDKLNHDLTVASKNKEADLKQKENEMALELKKLSEIKLIDPNADIGAYLTARESQPQVVQCGTLLASGAAPSFADETKSNRSGGWTTVNQ